jgi:serine/threonine protein kinase
MNAVNVNWLKKMENRERLWALFGVVRLVENKLNGSQLAVKYVEGGTKFDSDILFREVVILASLNHPCIIKILGLSLPSSECEEARVVTMFASNGSLEDALVSVKNVDVPSFWTHENISCMIIGLVHFMKYLHSRNHSSRSETGQNSYRWKQSNWNL